MTAVDQDTKLAAGIEEQGRLEGLLDARTLEILERRRKHRVTFSRRGWLVRRALLVADLIGLSLAFVAAELVWGPSPGVGDRYAPWVEILLFLATLPCWIVVAKLYGLYEHDEDRADHTTADDVTGVLHVVTVGTWLVFAAAAVTDVAEPQIRKFFTFWALAIVLVTVLRASARAFSRRQFAYLQNTLIVGAGEVGQQVAGKLLQHPEYGLNLVGFVDEEPRERRDELARLPVLGSPDELPALVRALDIERVVIAFTGGTNEQALQMVRSLREFDIRVDVVPRLYELIPPGADVHALEGLTVIGLPRPRLARSSRLIKRSMDLVISGAGLLVLSPLFLLTAIAIKLDSRGPVFFLQVRMGTKDRKFRIVKFRTMAVDADERKAEFAHLNKHAQNGGDPRMFKIPDDPRVTAVGRFLRRYSLDELPQLINVLKGEMSLVGPRPLILDEDRHVLEWRRERLRLKPGITGLWQVLGRDAIPFEEMIRLDYLYVTTWSLWNDLRLLFRTLPVVANGDSHGGNGTAPR